MRPPSPTKWTEPRAETTLLELLHQLTKWTAPQLCATVEALALPLPLPLTLILPLPLP